MAANRKRRRIEQPTRPASVPTPTLRLYWVAPFLIGVVVALLVVWLFSNLTRTVAAQPAPDRTAEPPSLGDLALMSTDELNKQDIALLNLRCADGLPGSEDVDVAKCLKTLDKWAGRVRSETNNNFYKFAADPADFNNSEGYFRMLMLVTVLQQDFGVHYNPERINKIDFAGSKDLFIHGMIDCDNGGTCVSMPVLYTTVAQRLDYPVYLVHAKKHVFCRWDAKDDRVNVEGTNQGMNSYADEYYMTWPAPIDPSEVRDGEYLKSLTPAEAFAGFLASRGHCLEDNKLYPEARVAYATAHKVEPDRKLYRGFLGNLMRVVTPRDVSHRLGQPKQPQFPNNGFALQP